MGENSMIQWYPGHMARAIREINEKIKLVDIVLVLLDARIPLSSLNPELKKILQNKKTLYVLTKKDKADDTQTQKWVAKYHAQGFPSLAIDARNPRNIKQLIKEIELAMTQKEKVMQEKD